MSIRLFVILIFVSTTFTASYATDTYELSKSESATTNLKSTNSKIKSYSPLIFSAKAYNNLSNFNSDSGTSRGAAETAIYERVASGTVLIATEDGLGSGALISSNGFIVTNFHVVGESKKVRVFFKPIGTSNDFKSAVELVGNVTKVNETNDLALVKVSSVPTQARAIPLVSSSTTKVGEDAHAVGHPRGEYWTYTRGYVSQIRDAYKWKSGEESPQHQADVIQTQTPINPGNSGGPLVNSLGQLIGLNSFGDPKSPGLNFAVAAAEIERFLKQEGSRRSPVKKTQLQNKCGKEPASEERRNLPGSGPTSVINYDSECAGFIDVAIFIPDNKSKPVVMAFYDVKTRKITALLYDYDRDGQFDETMMDSDGDGSFDMIGKNKPGELFASNMRKIS